MTTTRDINYSLPASLRSFLWLLLIAGICLLFADIEISSRNPGQELLRMVQGFLAPEFLPWPELLQAIIQTLSYALLAVSVAACCGFLLSFFYQHFVIRIVCASIRSVHELFWGLLFIQLVGLHPLAGFLAIALPYCCIFAKVFAEIHEEHSHTKNLALPVKSDQLSLFFYSQWPQLAPHFKSYTLYRLECGLRSSAVLGFIGLPTLGFHLETAFMQGLYAQAASILLIFYAMIASLRHWMKFKLLALYLIAALFALYNGSALKLSVLSSFFQDIIPSPLRSDSELTPWLASLFNQQILPGIVNTLLVTQIALALSALLALLLFPLISRQFFSKPIRNISQLGLIVLRSTPELIISFALLLLWGPSMLPAIVALGIHNGAIIAHLIGRHSNQISLRTGASTGFYRYSFEILPRIYGQFLAFLCYRWEVILRESAILGILGVHTLGFYIDSAFESFRLDVAVLLIAVSALLNITVDQFSRRLRHRLHLQSTPQARIPKQL